MKIAKNTNILIIGLGVIGGSYAEALTGAGYKVTAITRDECDIRYALERGIIERGYTTPTKETVGSADLIIFALYPTVFVEWIRENGSLIKDGAIVTDVTGVKSEVVKSVQNMLPSSVEFISAHPMAGKERSGVEYSDASVFKGANYIITPTEKNTREAIEVCRELGEILGFSRISELTVEEHDKMIAFLSQLTHCIAISLMTCNTSDGLERYTGDSFRDLTRIAKINDRMWSELFVMNKDALLSEMDAFIDDFKSLRDMIRNEDIDSMREKMRLATRRRTLFDKPKG